MARQQPHIRTNRSLDLSSAAAAACVACGNTRELNLCLAEQLEQTVMGNPGGPRHLRLCQSPAAAACVTHTVATVAPPVNKSAAQSLLNAKVALRAGCSQATEITAKVWLLSGSRGRCQIMVAACQQISLPECQYKQPPASKPCLNEWPMHLHVFTTRTAKHDRSTSGSHLLGHSADLAQSADFLPVVQSS